MQKLNNHFTKICPFCQALFTNIDDWKAHTTAELLKDIKAIEIKISKICKRAKHEI